MELPGVPSDTQREIRQRVVEGLRALGTEGRLAQTMALYRTANELAEAGILYRQGALDRRALQRQLALLRYGATLIARVDAHRTRLRT